MSNEPMTSEQAADFLEEMKGTAIEAGYDSASSKTFDDALQAGARALRRLAELERELAAARDRDSRHDCPHCGKSLTYFDESAEQEKP